MIYRRDIQGVRINFYIAQNAVPGPGPPRTNRMSGLDISTQVSHMADAIGRIPYQHRNLLTGVAIVIWNGRARGGWVPPEHTGRWTGPNAIRRSGVDGAAVAQLPHQNGIITITTDVLNDDPVRGIPKCCFTILHETGHCVDHHLGLGSPGDPDYRNGNLAYQGQYYEKRRDGNLIIEYDYNEFKAETYSRLFVVPASICVRGRAVPPCQNSLRHSTCNERLQRDLARSPAFRNIDWRRYLPLAAAAESASNLRASAARVRGPVGTDPLAKTPAGEQPQLAPHSGGCPPGPEGLGGTSLS